jgi:hypothetical protein
MLPQPEAQRLFDHALAEFAPDWEAIVDVKPITIRDRDAWLSGIGTFGVTLRHRPSGAIKVLGRRSGDVQAATYHRGISFLVLQAYGERNTDPIRRYMEEIGLAPTSGRRLAV